MAFHKISPVDPIDSEHVYSMVAFLENCISVLFAFGNFLHSKDIGSKKPDIGQSAEDETSQFNHPISSHPANNHPILRLVPSTAANLRIVRGSRMTSRRRLLLRDEW